MVMVIRSDSLGFGDYGARFSSSETQGIVWERDEFDPVQKFISKKIVHAKLTGGKKLLSSSHKVIK